MKGHVEVSVLPGCGVNNQPQQFALFAGALALELFARDTCKPHHVEASAQIGGRRFTLPDLGSQSILSRPKIFRLAVADRRGDHEVTSFTFLGYTFRPRLAKNRSAEAFRELPPGGQQGRGQGNGPGNAVLAHRPAQ